jgi:hypothetical protein
VSTGVDKNDPHAVSAQESQGNPLQMGVTELLQLARKAFDERRRTDCMPILNVILKLDPENNDARAMQSWIRADLDRELQHVRALLARLNKHEMLYNDARLMIQRVLDVDPDNKAAEALLQEIDSELNREEPTPKVPTQAPEVLRVPQREYPEREYPEVELDHRRGSFRFRLVILLLVLLAGFGVARYVSLPWSADDRAGETPTTSSSPSGQPNTDGLGTLEVVADDGIEVFVNDQSIGTAPIAPLQYKPGEYELKYKFQGVDVGQEKLTITAGQMTQNSTRSLLGSVELFVVPSSETVMQIDDSAPMPVPTHATVRPGSHRLTFMAPGYETQSVFVSVPAGVRRNVSAILMPVIPGATAKPRSETAGAQKSSKPAAATAPSNNAAPDGAGAKGRLAISSALPVDIYLDNNLVGSTPVTLELPAGTYTFEYRYGNLRKTAVNVIKGNEDTRATVTFEIPLRIESTSQAEVLIDGVQRQSLGQTPINAARVPIGSTLVFRAPGFPEKRHTVAENDTVIRVAFP